MDVENYVEKYPKSDLWAMYHKFFSNNECLRQELEDFKDCELLNNMIQPHYIDDRIKQIEYFICKMNGDLEDLKKASRDFKNRKMIEELKDIPPQNEELWR